MSDPEICVNKIISHSIEFNFIDGNKDGDEQAMELETEKIHHFSSTR